ncbi:SAV_2336 family protein [Streptomyces sp. NBC_01762]|uniref:SAV_2336 N-terminal domain-related protein n=1 Tax=Streptomyces sp. NBC_01762 TaxID=2975933 RepID=UPI002DDA70CE|nr:SAV_2336 N-terminal domain-related protein [Streptomyces sp. NBC_01762]WSC42578.1 SAV_2336 family protein [Streptomyces sp. NBC_01762]WSC50275.1 SAV_2336 family protein [Streptomyces sp. NBC_01762]
MSKAGSIAQFGAMLGALNPKGPLPSPREVAELLWLAVNLPGGAVAHRWPEPQADSAATATEPPRTPEPEASAEDTPEAAGTDGEPGQDARLYLPETDTLGEERVGLHRASPIRVAGAATLPRRRALARALRPLKRRVPSTAHTVLDEDATADRIADEARWMPVFVPAQERWLDLALIIDANGDGAALWEPLGRELLSVLQELGAFRDIRTYWLHRRPDGAPGLATGVHQSLRSPATASDPTGRTLTLVLTDGVDPAWGAGALRCALRQWARSGPAAILQTLPEHLWGQTALAPEPGRFHSTNTGGSNAQLGYTPYTLGSRAPEAGEIPVPVLGVHPEWLAPWAHAAASSGAFDGAAVRLRAADVEEGGAISHGMPPSGRAIGFEEFLAQAQPRVFRLAAFLSAAPLNLAVMRLVQSAMLPESPSSDLAEIAFSGLLRKLPGGSGGDALQQAYEFAPGVRERLLSTLRRDEADQVIDAVSTYVERGAKTTTARFTAAVADPEGPLLLPVGARHWAEVQDMVRRRQRRKTAVPREAAVAELLDRTAQVPAPAPRRVLADAPEPDPAAVNAPPSEPSPGEGRRFLITIGVSRYQDDQLVAIPDVASDIARVRSAFEALGYTNVLPQLADDPTATTVLQSMETWARSAHVRPVDMVVIYFSGHASAEVGTRLLTSDSRASNGQMAIGGLTVPQIQRAFVDGPGNLMLILDAYVGPHAPRPVLDSEGPQMWLLTCVQAINKHGYGSNFAQALTAELSSLRRDPPPPLHMSAFASRINVRMHQNPAPPGPSTSADSNVVWASNSTENLAIPHFFTEPDRSRATGLPPRAGIHLRADQSAAFNAIADWLRKHPEDHRPRIVTGDPGSGKTTLLTYLNQLMAQDTSQEADGLERKLPNSIKSVLLRALPNTTGDLWRDVGKQLALPGASEEECKSQLAAWPNPVVVLLDRLDETSESQRRRIIESVIRPLQMLPPVRLVISADSTASILTLGTEVELLDLSPLRAPSTGRHELRGSAFRVPGEVIAMAAIPSSGSQSLIVTLSPHGMVQIWDTETRSRVGGPYEVEAPGTVAIAVIQRADGSPLLATVNYAGQLHQWDASSGERLGDAGHVNSRDVLTMTGFRTGDGQTLLAVVGYDGKIDLWDPAAGRNVSEGLRTGRFPGRAIAAIIDPDGSRKITTADYSGRVTLWGMQPRRRNPHTLFITRPSEVLAMAAIDRPGRHSLLATVGYDHIVRVWDPFAPALPRFKHATFSALTPSDFESLVAQLFEAMGEAKVSSNLPGDSGSDLSLYRNDTGETSLVQLKHTRQKVSVETLQRLLEAVEKKGATKGIVVTSGGLSKACIEFADTVGNIEMIDGPELYRLVREYLREDPTPQPD